MASPVAPSVTLSEQVAEEIRALMARKRITGRQLARLLGVSAPWVNYRLTGAQMIGLNDLARIAEALGVPLVDLLPAQMRAANTGRYPRGRADRTTRPKGHANPVRDRPPTMPGPRRPALLARA